MAIYRVKGVYEVVETVDTDSAAFKEFAEIEQHWNPKITHLALVFAYAERSANWNMVDDDCHGIITASSLDWSL